MKLYRIVNSAVFCGRYKIAWWKIEDNGYAFILIKRNMPINEVIAQIKKDCPNFLTMYNANSIEYKND